MAKARLYFDGDNSGIEKEARAYSLTQEVEDKLDSISNFQDEIDDLQDQINNLASRGRYLSTWNCVTGLPETNPQVDPYVYRAGDYYIVSNVGGRNLRPTGAEYHIGVASQAVETQTVTQNDLYIYDGTQWILQGSGSSLLAVWGSITGNLQAQTDLQNALNDKANRTDVLEKTNTTSYTPTADYHPSTKKYSDDNDTYIGTSAPTNNVVEGRLWYDTAADVLKVYNGSQWVPTGKTYTAGQNIQISASDVISATDTTYNAGDNITIEDICTTESDMKGPAPDGFHVPLNTEWKAVRDIRVALGGGSSVNFGIALKLPFAGDRSYSSAATGSRGIEGNYWSSSRQSANFAYHLYFDLSVISPQSYNCCAYGYPVRCFKNSPTVPTSSWTKLYGTSIEAGGIFWSSTDGLISLSSDGNTWITIADKNLGATTVWNSGDTLSDANCGYYYQRGNNYSFPRTGSVTTSSTQVDASAYGPGNYYSSSTFITRSSSPYSWDTTDNGNLWGGVTQGTWQDCIHNVISATDTTYSATDFDIKDLADSTGLRTTWNNKQDALTAGSHINISSNAISTWGLQEELIAGDNITFSQECHPDTQGPCPDGFHVPTEAEFGNMISSRSTWGDGTSLYDYLKLSGNKGIHADGFRFSDNRTGYWTASPWGAGDNATVYYAKSSRIYSDLLSVGFAYYIRPFKNEPAVPDSSRTTLYDGSSIASGAGIFWDSNNGLISISKNGTDWITITDKNLGATNVGDSGSLYQRGNNYPYPASGNLELSSVKVDSSGYGPGHYFSSSSNVFITGGWGATLNGNARGGETNGTRCEPVISATDTTYTAGTGINIGANNEITADTTVLATQTDLSSKANATDVNTKTFNLASNQDLSTAQAAYDWWAAGGTPIISLGGTWLMRTLYSATVYSNSSAELQFVATNTRRDDVGGPTGGYTEFCSYFTSIRTDSTGTVTSVTGGETRNIKTLDPTYDYPTPYTPQYNGSPATKKYVDDSVIARVDATSPVSPLVGQLWYDTANSQLKLYDGSNRVSI